MIDCIREIRRNYIECDECWAFWTSVNQEAYRDARILPEVRLTFEAVMAGNKPMETKMHAVLNFIQRLGEIIGLSTLWGEVPHESNALLDLFITLLHQLSQCIPDPEHPISGDGRVDLWVHERLYIGIRKAERLTESGDVEGALVMLNDVVSLLEKTMKITRTTLKPSSPWLEEVV